MKLYKNLKKKDIKAVDKLLKTNANFLKNYMLDSYDIYKVFCGRTLFIGEKLPTENELQAIFETKNYLIALNELSLLFKNQEKFLHFMYQTLFLLIENKEKENKKD